MGDYCYCNKRICREKTVEDLNCSELEFIWLKGMEKEEKSWGEIYFLLDIFDKRLKKGCK